VTQTDRMSLMLRRMLELHNDVRQEHGLHHLSPQTSLEQAARRHALDLQAHDLFSHTGSDGSNHGSRIRKAGYLWAACAENIAWGVKQAGTSEAIFRLWKNSAAHKANILRQDMRDVGIGCVSGEYINRTLARVWVVDFGRRQ
jgi:uncharacterized protein YkwD